MLSERVVIRDHHQLVNRIKMIRKVNDGELSKLTGISRSTIVSWGAGKAKPNMSSVFELIEKAGFRLELVKND